MDYDPSIACYLECSRLPCLCCSKITYDFEGTLINGGDYDCEIICNDCLIRLVSNHKRSEKEKRNEYK